MSSPTVQEPRFRRVPPDRRRLDLIHATLRVIAAQGIEAASVRVIAAEAGVTPGLIRHHFSGKEDLLCAAYAHHMSRLVEASRAASAAGEEVSDSPASVRLAAFIRRTLSPPVTDPTALRLWAAFIQLIGHEPRMRQVHLEGYNEFRHCLERLIRAALFEAGRPCPEGELKRLAIACNALLDGLWIEGGALPDVLTTESIVQTGLQAVGRIIELPLAEKEPER